MRKYLLLISFGSSGFAVVDLTAECFLWWLLAVSLARGSLRSWQIHSFEIRTTSQWSIRGVGRGCLGAQEVAEDELRREPQYYPGTLVAAEAHDEAQRRRGRQQDR